MPKPSFLKSKRVRIPPDEAAEILRCVHKEWSEMVSIYWYPDREERLDRMRKIMGLMTYLSKKEEDASAKRGDERAGGEDLLPHSSGDHGGTAEEVT